MNIVALAIPTGSLSEDMGFREIVAPSALDRIFSDAPDLRLLSDHDPSKVLARRSSGTLDVSRDHQGLHIVGAVDMGITYTADVVRALERRDISGASFGFVPLRVSWSERGGESIRTIEDMVVRECSIVSWPCYTATHVVVRTATPVGQRSSPRRYRETLMNDDRLEIAAPRPGTMRDGALAELDRARAFWKRNPGASFEVRYELPMRQHATIGRPTARTRMPRVRDVSVQMLMAFAKQIAVSSTAAVTIIERPATRGVCAATLVSERVSVLGRRMRLGPFTSCVFRAGARNAALTQISEKEPNKMGWGRTVDIEPRYVAFLPDAKKAEKKLNSAVVLYRQHIAALRSAEGVVDVQASFDAKELARIAAKVSELEVVIAEAAARARSEAARG